MANLPDLRRTEEELLTLAGELVRVERALLTLAGEGALPDGNWIVSGSAVLVLHGLVRSRPVGDLDLFIATEDWFSLYHTHQWDLITTDPNDPARRCDPPYLSRVIGGLEVNVFFEWRTRRWGNFDVNYKIAHAETVRGWPCVPLRVVLAWKQEVGRSKDTDDIQLLVQHLQQEEQ
jgi:hypothetical protein